jgi:hypothetical protein
VSVITTAVGFGIYKAKQKIAEWFALNPPELGSCQIFEETMNGVSIHRFVFDTKQDFVIPTENLLAIMGFPVGSDDVDAVAHQSIGFMHFDEDEEEGTLH